MPVQASLRDQPIYTVIPIPPQLVAFFDTLRIRRTHSRLNPPGPSRELNATCNDISVIYLTAHRCAGGLKKEMKLNLQVFMAGAANRTGDADSSRAPCPASSLQEVEVEFVV